MAFLLAGPALDIVPIILTFKILGAVMGWMHLLGIAVICVIIGLVMDTVFKEKPDPSANKLTALPDTEISKPWWVQSIFFSLLILTMVFALNANWIALTCTLFALIVFLFLRYSRDDVNSWVGASVQFTKSIMPWLLIGSIGAAIVAGLLPSALVLRLAGGSSIQSSLTAASLGAILYVCPPSEVMFARAFIDLGMGMGPALAFLNTASSISLPSIIILNRVIGWQKTATNTVMLVCLAAISGFIRGLISM
ncbi:MAG: permease [Dehalococcoidia bacterium]|nr:permease [Dehalococcoidia bacterium]